MTILLISTKQSHGKYIQKILWKKLNPTIYNFQILAILSCSYNCNVADHPHKLLTYLTIVALRLYEVFDFTLTWTGLDMMHMNCLQIMWWRLLLPWVRRESPLFLMSWSIQQQQITWESCTRFRRDSAIAVLGCRLVISLLIIYLDKNITIPSPKKDRVHGEDRIWQCLRFF